MVRGSVTLITEVTSTLVLKCIYLLRLRLLTRNLLQFYILTTFQNTADSFKFEIPTCVLIWTGGNSGFQKWWHRRIWPTIHVESSIMMSVHFPQTCCDWKRIIPSCSEESMQVQDADSPSDVWMNSLPFEEVDGHKHGDPSFCYRGLFSSTQRLRHSQRDFNQTAYIHCCLVWQQRYWDL